MIATESSKLSPMILLQGTTNLFPPSQKQWVYCPAFHWKTLRSHVTQFEMLPDWHAAFAHDRRFQIGLAEEKKEFGIEM
jgi:hypothetical protein